MVLKGWIDARPRRRRRRPRSSWSHLDRTTIARFDTDQLLDGGPGRPVMRLVDGINEPTWPGGHRARAAAPRPGRQRRSSCSSATSPTTPGWRSPSRWSTCALDFGAASCIGLGAYPRRPPSHPPPAASARQPPTRRWPGRPLRSSVRGPRGRAGDDRDAVADGRGLPAIGLWAQVPHYVSAMPYPGRQPRPR